MTRGRRSARRVLAALVTAALAAPMHGQAGKKVFISADMEGISGISGSDQLSATGAEYNRSRKLMADDVNAAIRGARAGGATEIVVNDSHGSMRNLRLEDLDPSVRLISHSFKRHGMMEGLDDSFDAVIFVGYHAKAGAPRGVFAHTGSGVVADVRVNGRSLGEGGLNTLVAGWYGVPVVLVTGDDVAVAEVASVATGARTVAVKRAINQRAVELRPLADVHREIEAAARDAVAGARRTAPRRESAYNVEVQLRDTLIPQVAEILPGMKRPAPDTIAFSTDSMSHAYALIRLLYRYISPE
ncbi:MAG TPA: M55 family metallopeptidase [Vicinamibacterales bacterium]|nr:M55 family metallopeptidase [Vicinamibacterales bacterium]